MTGFKVKMVRSPEITDDERRRRLHLAYDILLDAARRARVQEMGGAESTLAGAESLATTPASTESEATIQRKDKGRGEESDDD